MINYHITRNDVRIHRGNPNGAIMPDYIGQLCIDDIEKVYYISTELNNNGWVASSVEVDISSKQDITDNNLNTTNKTITGAINELKDNKQGITDNNLSTTNKTIIGAINELKDKVDETFQEVDSGKTLIAAAIDNSDITSNSTFSAMSDAITDIRNRLYNLMVEGEYEVNSSMNMDSLLDLLELSGIGVNDIKQIACGNEHTVVLKKNGSVYVCGYNNHGQLGLGDKNERTLFTQVTTNVNNDVKQIACGNEYTVILKKDGSVYTCGANTNGQLGIGNTTTKTTFTQVITNISNDVKQIACGQNHTLILKNDGTVWSCGYNNFGQLGLGNTATKNTFTQATTNISSDVKEIACGDSYTFIIKNDGSLWGCGYNGSGQLGLGNTTTKNTFTQVTTNINNDIKQVACGQNHTIILKNDGSVWSCGYNNYGQLGWGTSDTDAHSTFTKVTTNINSDAKQIDCGDEHTFIIKTDGSLWGCGYNGSGQLGLGDTINRSTFVKVTENISNDVKQVACGGYHTIILKKDGGIWSCGYNYNGELGLGDSYDTGGSTEYTNFTDVLRGL